MEILLIDANYLKRVTNLNGAVDEATLPPAIIAAQDMSIQMYTGSDLLDKLKADAQAGTLAGAYKTLVDDYLRKALAWLVMEELLPSLYVQIDNGGLVIRSAEGTTAISETELQREVDRARNKAKFYLAQMCNYMSYNSASLPEYGTNSQNRIAAKRFSYHIGGLHIGGRAGKYTNEIYSTR